MSRLEHQLCELPLGYRARESVSRADREPSEHRDLVLRFGIAAFFWLNSMASVVGNSLRLSRPAAQYS